MYGPYGKEGLKKSQRAERSAPLVEAIMLERGKDLLMMRLREV